MGSRSKRLLPVVVAVGIVAAVILGQQRNEIRSSSERIEVSSDPDDAALAPADDSDDAPSPAGDALGIAPWPAHLVETLGVAGSDAYGWQQCTIRAGYDEQPDNVSLSTGVYDPSSDVALRSAWVRGGLEERTTQEGDIVLSTQEGTVDRSWGEAEVHKTMLSLAPLRSASVIETVFDFEVIAPDPVDPEAALPMVRRFPLPVVDPDGHAGTARMEGVPDGWPATFGSSDSDVVVALKRMTVVQSAVWALDLWADGDVVNRIRYQTQDADPMVAEIRFVEVGDALQSGDLVEPDCPSGLGQSSENWLGFQGWEQSRTVPLRVSVDSAGRPYDVSVWGEIEVRHERVGTLAVPGGELLVMDGISIQVDPKFFADESVSIRLKPDSVDGSGVESVDVSVIWQRQTADDGSQRESILGISLGSPDAEVSAWDPFEYAYGTDGGVGGLIAASVVDEMSDDHDGYWIEDTDNEVDYQFFDSDSIPGPETFIFRNGLGNGGFPMSQGRDGAGDVVATTIWGTGVPWRLAVPGGDPPPDVTKREDALVECLSGLRPVTNIGTCPADED